MEPMENNFVQGDSNQTIALNMSLCLDLLKNYFTIPNIVSDASLIDDQRARLVVWASDVDVYGLDEPYTPVEYRLRDHPKLVRDILKLLDDVYYNLMCRKSLFANIKLDKVELQLKSLAIVKPVDDQYSVEEQMQENDSLITDTIGGIIQRLYVLRSVITISAAT
jgi:hypothetical protein